MKTLALWITIALLTGCANNPDPVRHAKVIEAWRGVAQFLSEAPPERHLKDILFPLPETNVASDSLTTYAP